MPTAIARYFTTGGFIIAADGKTTSPKNETIDCNAQKVFAVAGQPLAYALYGYATIGSDEDDNEPPVVDLVSEVKTVVDSLAGDKFPDLMKFGEQLATPINRLLLKAKTDGRIATYPGGCEFVQGTSIAHIYLFGYSNGVASEVDITFWHRDHNLRNPIVAPMKISRSNPRVWGSPDVAKLLFESDDARFARFRLSRVQRPEEISLSEAAKIAQSYILACDSEEGRSVDPYMCPMIGGHIHIAQITSQNGFEWVIPPKFGPVIRQN